MTNSEEEIKKALEEVLALYDIKLEFDEEESEETHDYSGIISKTQERLDELTEKAEEIYKRTGMTRDQLEIYGSNPNNFSKEQWEALQKVKEACEKYKREGRARIGEEHFKKSAEQRQKKKQPHKFAKKKHWIPL